MTDPVLPGPHQPIDVRPAESRMRPLSPMTEEELIAYNLRGGGYEFTEFEHAQPDRVRKAQALINLIRAEDPSASYIVEPGCSTGDISGPYTKMGCKVLGIDVTPGAAEAARRKWPRMDVLNERIERVAPVSCDILVLCEFLEHIEDPVGFIEAWVPRANYVIIGHPLVGDGGDPEPGHKWAYYPEDFANWFVWGDHELRGAWEFPMGYRMVIGWGQHR